MKIGDRVLIIGTVDEIRKDTVIIRNEGGYFGTVKSEIIEGDLIRCRECIWWAKEVDSLQGRCALLEIHPTGAWFCANGKAEMDEVTE